MHSKKACGGRIMNRTGSLLLDFTCKNKVAISADALCSDSLFAGVMSRDLMRCTEGLKMGSRKQLEKVQAEKIIRN